MTVNARLWVTITNAIKSYHLSINGRDVFGVSDKFDWIWLNLIQMIMTSPEGHSTIEWWLTCPPRTSTMMWSRRKTLATYPLRQGLMRPVSGLNIPVWRSQLPAGESPADTLPPAISGGCPSCLHSSMQVMHGRPQGLFSRWQGG